ncbi:hypothetical protein C0995_014354, partial [Termitomyces sp. Mi166
GERENEEGQEEAVARPDISADDGMVSSEETHNPEGGESAATEQKGGAQGAMDEDAAVDTRTKDDSSPFKIYAKPNQSPADDPRSSDSQTAGTASFGAQEGPMQPSRAEIQSSTNPLRFLGDSLKEIRQRFDDIITREQRDIPREKIGDVDVPSQVEYLQPDDVDHDMEALGPAEEEQAAKLNDLKLIDGDQQTTEYAPMDIDLPSTRTFNSLSKKASPMMNLLRPSRRMMLKNACPISDELAFSSDTSTRKADVDMEDMADEAVEAGLRAWQITGFPDTSAEKVWRLYESLTHDLAYALCEQLRLILEPTLATRLKGDYRTGKRLNMKKIISYIASDYTKDKIWLRRTRPSQREYQVLISIDNSRSMAESHSVHLAYQTLALISKALNRLEAGDIAIAKFGETVDILHGFDE